MGFGNYLFFKVCITAFNVWQETNSIVKFINFRLKGVPNSKKITLFCIHLLVGSVRKNGVLKWLSFLCILLPCKAFSYIQCNRILMIYLFFSFILYLIYTLSKRTTLNGGIFTNKHCSFIMLSCLKNSDFP